MAQSGYTPLSLYYSATASTAPLAANLVAGELALNTNDGKLYYKDSSGVVQVLATKAGSSGSFGALSATSITDSGLTSGRVTYATTGGLLTDSANFVFDGNNAGIGVTPSAFGSGFKALQMNGGSLMAYNGTNMYYLNNTYFDGANYKYVNNGFATNYTQTSGIHAWATAPSGTAGATATFSELMRISSNGNVGIGTTSPTYPLVISNGGAQGFEISPTATANAPTIISYNRSGSAYTQLTYSALQHVFSISGTETMRIDSSGNVGIGTSSPSTKLQVTSSAATINAISMTGSTTAGTYLQMTTTGGIFTAGLDSSTASVFGNAAYSGNLYMSGAYPMLFWTNAAERMRIDSSGNVGIGTNSPGYKLDVYGNLRCSGPTNGSVIVDGAAAGNPYVGFAQSNALGSYIQMVGTAGSNELLTNVNGAERMRINSSGSVMIGTTGVFNSGKQCIAFSGDVSQGLNIRNNADRPSDVYVGFYNAYGTNTGTITSGGSSTSYNTSSDYRLKDNVQPLTNALDKVLALKPVTYLWKTGGEDNGFIAHELQAVLPNAVSGEKDAVDKDGNIKPQGVDYSKIVATLTAAIQEQQALITDLTTRLAALEAK